MENALIVVCVCLSVSFFVLLIKFISLKRNIRRFSRELEKLKNADYRQPVKVTDFDKDIVELAVKVNEHTDIQRELREDYEKSKAQLSTVISGISHDFRTPLTASLGYLQMIEKSGELSEKNAGYLDIAVQKNKYLKELSDEFFELTKLESGRNELIVEKVNLSNILTQTLLEQHSWIEERNIQTEFDIQDGIIIDTDKRCLERILNNLMSNAQKYAEDCMGVSLNRADGKTVLRIYNSVSDASSIDVSRVFEPFFRMYPRTAEGTGLGLYVVKLLCDRLSWEASASLDHDKEGKDIFSVCISI